MAQEKECHSESASTANATVPQPSPGTGPACPQAQDDCTQPAPAPAPATKRRVIRRRNKGAKNNKQSAVIDPVLLEKTLAESNLPSAYTFEIPKTVQRILSLKASHIALQLPEGLLLYATVLSDVLLRLAAPTLQHVSILGDVTYGACCVDDLGAKALNCQLLVHYGHSCLVPIQHTAIPCLYVFVEITIDVPHLVQCTHKTLASTTTTNNNNNNKKPYIYLMGTIQFRHALLQAQESLQQLGYIDTVIPQAKPLSPGEVLGCTSPKLLSSMDTNQHSSTIVLFIADGRFHLESTMISNPNIDTFYRYDPYSKVLTIEEYNHEQMHSIRKAAIQKAKQIIIKDDDDNDNNKNNCQKTFGIILGTLGRQGNPAILLQIQRALQKKHNLQYFVILLSEITPYKLSLFRNKIDVWVQVACPRLSVDWGHFLGSKPVLNSYELMVCLGETEWKQHYPMDYYASSGGKWSNYHEENKNRQIISSII